MRDIDSEEGTDAAISRTPLQTSTEILYEDLCTACFEDKSQWPYENFAELEAQAPKGSADDEVSNIIMVLKVCARSRSAGNIGESYDRKVGLIEKFLRSKSLPKAAAPAAQVQLASVPHAQTLEEPESGAEATIETIAERVQAHVGVTNQITPPVSPPDFDQAADEDDGIGEWLRDMQSESLPLPPENLPTTPAPAPLGNELDDGRGDVMSEAPAAVPHHDKDDGQPEPVPLAEPSEATAPESAPAEAEKPATSATPKKTTSGNGPVDEAVDAETETAPTRRGLSRRAKGWLSAGALTLAGLATHLLTSGKESDQSTEDTPAPVSAPASADVDDLAGDPENEISKFPHEFELVVAPNALKFNPEDLIEPWQGLRQQLGVSMGVNIFGPIQIKLTRDNRLMLQLRQNAHEIPATFFPKTVFYISDEPLSMPGATDQKLHFKDVSVDFVAEHTNVPEPRLVKVKIKGDGSIKILKVLTPKGQKETLDIDGCAMHVNPLQGQPEHVPGEAVYLECQVPGETRGESIFSIREAELRKTPKPQEVHLFEFAKNHQELEPQQPAHPNVDKKDEAPKLPEFPHGFKIDIPVEKLKFKPNLRLMPPWNNDARMLALFQNALGLNLPETQQMQFYANYFTRDNRLMVKVELVNRAGGTGQQQYYLSNEVFDAHKLEKGQNTQSFEFSQFNDGFTSFEFGAPIKVYPVQKVSVVPDEGGPMIKFPVLPPLPLTRADLGGFYSEFPVTGEQAAYKVFNSDLNNKDLFDEPYKRHDFILSIRTDELDLDPSKYGKQQNVHVFVFSKKEYEKLPNIHIPGRSADRHQSRKENSQLN